jgi:hypothetical protein
MRQIVKNQSGMSLISAVVASAIGLIVFLAIGTAVGELVKRQKAMTAAAEAGEIIHSIRSAVIHQTSCSDMFENQPFELNVPVALAKPVDVGVKSIWLQENMQVGKFTPTSIKWKKAEPIPGVVGISKEFLAELEIVLTSPNFQTTKKIDVIVGANDPGPGSSVLYCYQLATPVVSESALCSNLGGTFDTATSPKCTITTVSVMDNTSVQPAVIPAVVDKTLLAKNVCGKLGKIDATGKCSISLNGFKFHFQTQYYTNPRGIANADLIADQAAAEVIKEKITSAATSP